MKKVCAFHYLSLLLGFVLSVGDMGSAFSAEAEVRSIPAYEAKTAEECVEERLCVWHVFSKLFLNAQIEVATSDKGTAERYKIANAVIHTNDRLKKWAGPVNVYILGDKEGQYTQDVEDALEELRPYFPYEMKVQNKDVNTLVVFSKDFDEDIRKKYSKILLRTFGEKVSTAYERYESAKSKSGKDRHCFSAFGFSETNNKIGWSVIFSDPDEQYRIACLQRDMLHNLTAPASLLSMEWSALNVTPTGKDRITLLDKFLLYLLYQTEFAHGMNVYEVQSSFKKVYLEALKSFNSQ